MYTFRTQRVKIPKFFVHPTWKFNVTVENYHVYSAIMCRWAIFHTKLLDTSMNSESYLFLMVKAIFSQIPRYHDLGISTYLHNIPMINSIN